MPANFSENLNYTGGEEGCIMEDAKNSWEIKYEQLKFVERVANGAYGVVHRGQYRNGDVAIKEIRSLTSV